MGFYAFLAVGCGAAIGAWLRWWLGMAFNPVFPTLPLGTLFANLIGGYVMGLAMGVFSHFQALPVEVRLFVATGLLGGLTTFSTFSAETVTLFARQQYTWASIAIGVHVAGSLLMTALGIATVNLFKN